MIKLICFDLDGVLIEAKKSIMKLLILLWKKNLKFHGKST